MLIIRVVRRLLFATLTLGTGAITGAVSGLGAVTVADATRLTLVLVSVPILESRLALNSYLVKSLALQLRLVLNLGLGGAFPGEGMLIAITVFGKLLPVRVLSVRNAVTVMIGSNSSSW